MSVPITRQTFKEYCLRKIGWPVVEVNLDDDQIEDRIDEALRYYMDYHFDASERFYLKHQCTDEDKANHFITLPDNVIGVTRVFNISDPSMRTSDIFNIRYQIALNDLYTLTSVSMVPYYLAMEHLALIQELLVGQQPIRFNRHLNKVSIDMSWDKIATGEYLMFECYRVIDPLEFPDVWGDRWLQNYATVLIQENWGKVLTKFANYQTSSGIIYNGQRILDDAQRERKELEDVMVRDFSLPVSDFYG